MRILLSVLVLLFTAASARAQTFGYEWINANQQYYKIPVGEDGIYRITYDDLQAAGFPVAGVDPRRLQLFFRGEEQAILVSGQLDARLDPADYILFYGQRNDGTLDTELYVAPDAQPHAHYNLYSDTTAYFLTWRLDAGTGRRMTTFSENNVTNLPAVPYHLKEETLVLADEYAPGRRYPLGTTSGINARLSAFDYGEGWTGPRLRQGVTADYTLPVVGPVPTGPAPRLRLVLAGRNERQHRVTVQVGSNAGSLRTLTEITFDYQESYILDETLDWSDVGGEQFTVRLTVNGVDGQADNVSLSYVQLTYAQRADAAPGDLVVRLPANPSGKSFLTVDNPPPSPVLLDITDARMPELIGTNTSGTQLTAVVPNTATARQLLLSTTKAVPNLRRTDFTSLNTAATFLMVSHTSLHRPGGQYGDPVAAYEAYRSSPEGGNHVVQSVDVGQLYDYFSYGEVSPLAIRRFCHYLISRGSPEYLLIIGKGLKVNFNYHRQDPATTELVYYVPTGGLPGSDIAFTAGLPGSDGVGPALATGRINARNPQEVANYLDKVKEQEARDISADYSAATAREALWKKRLVHLSGGVTTSEFTTFGRYVDDFESVAVDNYLGGRVSTQSKKTNNATELINISDEVNQGVGLITFFGHSSSIRTDIEIGRVSNDELGYRNQGKYTAILLNGCNAGDIFNTSSTFGEDWISTAHRGALHVIAHSSIGLSSILKRYSDSFYATAFGDSLWIDQPLGKIKAEVGRRFLAQSGSPWEAYPAQVQQLVLQGDPAVTLFGRGQPDYEVSSERVFLEPLDNGPVTASSDSFAVNVVVRNFGRTRRDSLAVRINRTLDDGSTVSYGPRYFPAVHYQDTLSFVIADSEITANQSSGDNRFEVIVDETNEVTEINENNNRTTLEYFVPTSGTVNLSPHNYALVGQATVALLVQPGNLPQALQIDEVREFLVELDTSAQFDSPLKQQTALMATALARWSVELPLVVDSTVYYWRSKYAAPQPGEVDRWTGSSFTYVADSPPGWIQRQPTQWLENQVSGLTYSDGWQFEETSLSVEVDAYGSENAQENPAVSVNGKSFIITSGVEKCRDNSLNGMAFDRNSLLPYLAIKRDGFDEPDKNSCGPLPQVVNTFNDGQVATGLLTQYIDAVADGDPVLLFSIGQLNYPTWDAAVLTKLEEIGVDTAAVGSLQTGEPLIILGRKNATPGTATVVRADSTGEVSVAAQALSLSEQITGQLSRGSIVSRRIGPASSWDHVRLQLASDANDNLIVSLVGERDNGPATVLLDNLAEQSQADLANVDAAQYPYLRLRLGTDDAADLTPAQLRQWQVTYTGVPEGTLLPVAATADTLLAEGEPFSASFRFYNLSTHDFTDSLTVAYALVNQATQTADADTLRIAPLSAGDTATFSLATSTTGRGGINDVSLDVNPRLLPEQSYNNNRATLRSFFEVISDVAHPTVDVAFDGVYIRDGDVVSPQPRVSVVVRDENPIRRKQDTTGVYLFLRKQPGEGGAGGTDFEAVRLSSDEVRYTPATDSLPFRLEYQPTLADGRYTLRVQAEDESGNASGMKPYEINFEVVNAATVTYHPPYPNPLETHTYFALTVTGPTVPEQLTIRIMTATGQLVREITQDELGPLRVGSENIRYRWDGRGTAGNLLASGMYLYQITVPERGGFAPSGGASFGKLYILR